MKKTMLGVWIAVSLLSATACGNKAANEGAPSSPNNEKKTLTIVNWKGYGSDDPEVIKTFETKYNVKIVHPYMASEEELLTKLRTSKPGDLDVVLPNASILPVAINDGLLSPVDTAKLSNYAAIYEPFKHLAENAKDGAVYAVPWVWGSTAIVYNPDTVKGPIDSVQALWDTAHKGKIAFRDDFNDAVMTAALALGQNPNHPSDLDAIKQKLIKQKPLNRTYWKTGDEFAKLYAGGTVDIGLMWSGQTAAMKKEGQHIKYVIPKEGAIGWVDNWAIVKGTRNPELAHQFIDFMIDKKFQEDWVNRGGPAPVNKNVTRTLDPAFVEEMGLDEKTIGKLTFISYRSDEEKKKWNELWLEVKSH
ncbi:PotD/PotF family extracellular solute-binding protein [Paenibacillus sp. R14(2021)]|uniref:ABC transporter substrate-binding protein n=1 Tax=Paenibacillus sp. R14(2021) TaxID=2859228 RepID=UPI001C615F0C|nr:ABC transporter substrate-binding protein [Paenibacillus sp. R14(2021)]